MVALLIDSDELILSDAAPAGLGDVVTAAMDGIDDVCGLTFLSAAVKLQAYPLTCYDVKWNNIQWRNYG